MESDIPHPAITGRSPHSPPYKRHRPEQTLLYQLIERHYPEFRDAMAMQGKHLSLNVQQEFTDYLKCGRLEHGFLRVQCRGCQHEHLVAFSCQRRGFCSSCGARRLAESAALLVDEVLPEQPIRQWVLGAVYRVISTHLIKKTGLSTYRPSVHCRHPQNCCLRRGPHLFRIGLHSAGFSHFSTRYGNRRIGRLADLTIKELAETIRDAIGYSGQITFVLALVY